MESTTGLVLIRVAAWATIVVPVAVDGVIYRTAHMANSLWLPHAKLHGAMSFHAAIALGLGALLVLRARRGRLERSDLAISAFLSCAFWVCLLTARLWPGTSYAFAQDPAFADMRAPSALGVEINANAALSVLVVVVSVVGYALAARALARPDVQSTTPALA